ncbi:MAG: 50S ribosomal protein L3 [Elusimicrobia bacterium]|nr:50S ribosomal protein L3 [Elusimicrobiota bacterium]
MSEPNATQNAPVAAPEKEAPSAFKRLIGRKLGMTQIFDQDGRLYGVSVVEAGPCKVVGVRKADTDGYNAVCLGFSPIAEKKLNKAQLGQFKKAGVEPLRILKEFRVDNSAGFELGQTVGLKNRFAQGDYIDVQGRDKGHGFSGGMKRHGFRGLPASHGASDKERSPGSLASQRSLGRVIPGQRMAGRMGFRIHTITKLEVVKVDEAKNLIYLNGSVPGAAGSTVFLLETTRTRKKKLVQAPKADKKAKKAAAPSAPKAAAKK